MAVRFVNHASEPFSLIGIKAHNTMYMRHGDAADVVLQLPPSTVT
jgi:hypothetical protein